MNQIPPMMFGVVAVLTVVSIVLPSRAQHEPEFPFLDASRFAYLVKFSCGESVESFQEGVVKGKYATAITIHNPSLHFRLRFYKKVSRALPYQTPGEISEFEQVILGPKEAIEVECNELRQKLSAPMSKQFRTGFLMILSRDELDVVAVYSSRPQAGEVSAIDVEVIRPSKRVSVKEAVTQ